MIDDKTCNKDVAISNSQLANRIKEIAMSMSPQPSIDVYTTQNMIDQIAISM